MHEIGETLPDIRAAAADRLQRIGPRLQAELPEVLTALPAVLRGAPERYLWVPEALVRANAAARSRGARVPCDVNRYALLNFIANFTPDGGRYRLPASVAALYPRELRRILRQTESLGDDLFDLGSDAFLKDLAIVTHRLIPVGAEFAEGGAGIPRRVLLGGGPKQGFDALRFVLFRCGGLKPFFSLHAHTLALDDFNPQGWLATYRRLAELVALNPQMKGWQSASWFLDPALEDISPHLAYLRKVPTEGGAALLFVCRHPDGGSGALAKSPHRRRLFAEGRYVPATYMRIWPRRALLEWSRRQQDAAEG